MKYQWALSHLEGPSGREPLGPRGPIGGAPHLEGQGLLRGNPRAPPPREETLGRPPRGCPLLQGGCPSPPPINSGGGGTRFTHNRNCSLPKGCPLLLPLIRLDLISTIDSRGDQDLFVGLTWWPRSVRGRVHLPASPTLHQLFRCRRSVTVERLREGKLDLTFLTCIFLDPFLGLAFVVPKIFVFYSESQQRYHELV